MSWLELEERPTDHLQTMMTLTPPHLDASVVEPNHPSLTENPLLAGALRHRERGWAILPLRPGSKEPLTAHGHKDASLDPDVIREWWTEHPHANVGVSTGQSGLLVIDVDEHKGADLDAWVQGREWPETYTTTTGGGGRQFWFAQPAHHRFGNTASRLAPHIDTRGFGGYVVAPPSVTSGPYRVDLDTEPAQLPAWIIDQLSDGGRVLTDPGVRTQGPDGPWVTSYGGKALEDEARRLAATAHGRNAALNKVSYRMGQLIAANHLDRATVEARLTAAAQSASLLGDHPLSGKEIARTMTSGIDAGLARPAANTVDPPPPRRQPAIPTGALNIRPVSSFTAPVPGFLWGGRLCEAGLTILAGDGGIGKSFLTIGLAVGFANGTGLPGHGPGDRGGTLFISYEDPGEIINSRLSRMGYDPDIPGTAPIDVIYAPEALQDDNGPVMFGPEHVPALREQLKQCPDTRMVVIDPLMSFVGNDVNTNRDSEVRAVLHNLVGLAEELRVAVVVVAHTVKGTPDPTRALDCIAGSAGIKNLARSALIAMHDGETGRNYLFHRKHNWTPRAEAIEYRLTDGEFEWAGLVDDRTFQQICERRSLGPVERCGMWLRDYLRAGPRRATEVIAAGEACGYGVGTIRSARQQLGVKSDKPGFQAPSYWHLPDDLA